MAVVCLLSSKDASSQRPNAMTITTSLLAPEAGGLRSFLDVALAKVKRQ